MLFFRFFPWGCPIAAISPLFSAWPARQRSASISPARVFSAGVAISSAGVAIFIYIYMIQNKEGKSYSSEPFDCAPTTLS